MIALPSTPQTICRLRQLFVLSPMFYPPSLLQLLLGRFQMTLSDSHFPHLNQTGFVIDHDSDFTESGQSWDDGVRKCLQVALVPSLRPWIRKTCADIRSDAFDSHPGCYLTPGSGAPSICKLPCSDVWRAFWVVNVIGDAFTSEPYETGVQMLRVMRGCFGTTNCIGIGVETLTFTIPGLAIYRGARLFSRAIITKVRKPGWQWNWMVSLS